MHDIVDLDQYPLDRPESDAYRTLMADCKALLARNGMFNLAGFVRPQAVDTAVAEALPVFETKSFEHARSHNIYFKKSIDGLAPDHPALRQFETSNHTICADQVGDGVISRLYEWPPLIRFLAEVMDKPVLYTMADPLARFNMMSYRDGQSLNWHFDRSEFTTTLLIQEPCEGGVFEYVTDLRSDTDPNYDGVADLLEGRVKPVQMPVDAGTLNVFKGKNTAHRVTPARGEDARIIAVFSYYEKPGVAFSEEERIGFYGRAA